MKKAICLSDGQALRKSAIAVAVHAAMQLPLAAARACGMFKPAMLIDAQQQFSDSQALTATALSTNIIDLGSARAMSNGEPLGIVFNVEVAADQTTGDETYQFDVEVATNSGITTGRQLLGRRLFQSTVTAPAENTDLLVAGFKFVIPLPMSALSEAAEFLAVRYTLGGTTPSVTVSAHLMPLSMIEVGQVSYPKGYTIS